eukprot:TRINITY_DN2350_c2_g1_i1.p1 TRINITY_DN2350_c2_g1~~TRINITY_DN2350_c2_g1_i1.p1  ORF type:complete len:522 (+),score=154.13 TRINITY_DN2350_c2_g1_i1:90-1655(+)
MAAIRAAALATALCATPALGATQQEIEDTAKAASSFAVQWQDLRVVTLTFATEEFADVVVNWCVALRRIGRDKGYAIAALDEPAIKFLTERQLPAFELRGYNPAEGPKTLWLLRTYLLLTILEAGVSVVVSDADAVWLRDPLPVLFSESPPADISTMRGAFPPELSSRAGGAAANMGFAAFRAGASTVDFVRRAMLPHTEFWGDDQKGLNYALFACGVRWEGDMAYKESKEPAIGTVDAQPRGVPAIQAPLREEWGAHLDPARYVGEEQEGAVKLTIRLLPHSVFPRLCQPFDIYRREVQVMHCYVPADPGAGGIHTADHKLSGLDKFRVRFLRRDWREMPSPSSGAAGAYLDLCTDRAATAAAEGPPADPPSTEPAPASESAEERRLREGWARLRAVTGSDPKVQHSGWATAQQQEPEPTPPPTPHPPAARMRPGLRVVLLRDFKLGTSLVLARGAVGLVSSEASQPGKWRVVWESVVFGTKTKLVKIVSADDVEEAKEQPFVAQGRFRRNASPAVRRRE